MLHYLSYIDYVLYAVFLLPIAPSDVSAVARSMLDFFKCLFLVVQACISTRICVWLHFPSFRAASLWSLSRAICARACSSLSANAMKRSLWNTLFKVCLLLLIEERIEVNQCQSLVWASISLVGKAMAFCWIAFLEIGYKLDLFIIFF